MAAATTQAQPGQLASSSKSGSGGEGKALQHAWCFWYMRRGANRSTAPNSSNHDSSNVAPAATNNESGSGALMGDIAPSSSPGTESYASGNNRAASQQQQQQQQQQQNPYGNSIKSIATVQTVEEFWSVYDWLVRPNQLQNTTDYHFFRAGIKPTWEDSSNSKGGKWIVRLRKGLASRYWEEILLAMIGNQQFYPSVPDGEINGAVVSIRYSEDIISVWNRNAQDREATDKIRDAIKKILRLPGHVHMEYKPHQASLQDKSSFRNTTVWKATKVDRPMMTESRRSSSWGEREKPIKRDTERSWR